MSKINSATLRAILSGSHQWQGKKLADGDGLWLRRQGSAAYWLFRYQLRRKPRELGIGPLGLIDAGEARRRALEFRLMLARGVDPAVERERKVATNTLFREVAEGAIAAYKALPLTEKSWYERERLINRCIDEFGDWPIANMTADDIGPYLEDRIKEAYATGHRQRAAIEWVFNYAKKQKQFPRGQTNPANPDLLKSWLQDIPKPPTHHLSSMPFADVPGLMAKLASMNTMRSLALQLAILSGLRTNEVLQAEWREFDLRECVWSVPDEHMKKRFAHFVPISSGIASVLDRARPFRFSEADHVFRSRGGRKVAHLAPTALLDLLQKELGLREYTVHGFRSSIRDWGGKQGYADPVMERVLAHKKGGTEGAYHRDNFFHERIKVMERWSRFAYSEVPRSAGLHLKAAA